MEEWKVWQLGPFRVERNRISNYRFGIVWNGYFVGHLHWIRLSKFYWQKKSFSIHK